MNDLQPRSARLQRTAPMVAALLVAVGSYLRFRGLGEYWVNPDEGIYYSTLTQPSFAEFWSEVLENAHPPGYYLLLRTFGFLTWDFVWLRGTSAIFGGVAIWLMWLVGRELGGRGAGGAVVGLGAAALMAFNGEAIALSQVIRPYALLLALLAGSVHALLAYVREPTRRRLGIHAALMAGALLTHYSAALALGAMSLLAVHEWASRRIAFPVWARVMATHAAAGVLLLVLYLGHLRGLMSSALATTALDGWLAHWLVSSPGEAWRALITFQTLITPVGWIGRATVILLVAMVWATMRRDDRRVAVLAASGLGIALLSSALEFYPFGGTRHAIWLVPFTLPALAWLPAAILRMRRRRAVLTSVPLAAVILLGAPFESLLVPSSLTAGRTSTTDERTVRTRELAPMVVGRLDPEGAPRIILMTEQSYYLMIPLYPRERHPIHAGSDERFFHFGYGQRRVVVVRSWDWAPPFDLMSVMGALGDALPDVVTERDRDVLVVAGGWGSALFTDLPGLRARGMIRDESVVLGETPQGERIVRVLAATVDRGAP